MKFDYYVHGLWVLGTVFFFFGALFSGNVEMLEGYESGFAVAILLIFIMFLLGGMCWISAAVNARQEEKK